MPEGRTLVPEGRTLVPEGRTLVPEGRTLARPDAETGRRLTAVLWGARKGSFLSIRSSRLSNSLVSRSSMSV